MLGKTTSERKKARAESKKAREAKDTHKEFLDAKQNRIEAENAAKQGEGPEGRPEKGGGGGQRKDQREIGQGRSEGMPPE